MSRYGFEFSWASTYGRAAKLLDDVCRPGIVLDLGCGEGVFAEPVTALGREYLGVDLDHGSVERCRDRGLDVHRVDLAAADTDALHDHLVGLVAGRPVAAVTALDVVEHLVDPSRVFTDLARLIGRLDDPRLVVSIPNVAHLDLGAKLVFGRWDVTETGLLDDTHITLFDVDRLRRTTQAAGFVEIGRNDVDVPITEQAFPPDHPAVSPTNVREFLTGLRASVDEHGSTYQFVRAYAATTPTPGPAGNEPLATETPFCSVVVRTQGLRSSLDDALTSLAAQTDRDVEVIVTAHTDDDTVVDALSAKVAEYAPAFAGRVRIDRVIGGGRAAPLNHALDVARGRYVAFLDDDDIVMAHWIEQFRVAAARGPGTVLRTLCVAQAHRRRPDGLVDYEPVDGFATPFSRRFDLLEHRHFNQSPICSWAVPVAAVRALRLQFDDALPVCEDWELLVRAASLLGVSNVEEFTSVYRRFSDDWTSTQGYDHDAWMDVVRRVRHRLDRSPTLVPPGAIEQLSDIRDRAAFYAEAYEHTLARVEALERSRYWRLTAPLRWLTARRGGRTAALLTRLRRSAGPDGAGDGPAV